MGKILLSMLVGLSLWFLILIGIEKFFDFDWLKTGKYYVLAIMFVITGIINLTILNFKGKK